MGVDFTKDPKNCGACGHDCLGSDCSSSACSPYVVASMPANGYVALDDKSVYYTTPTGIFSHSLYGDASEPPVQVVVFGPTIADLAVANGQLYWSDTQTQTLMTAVAAMKGQTGSTIFKNPNGFPAGVAADSSGVYATMPGDIPSISTIQGFDPKAFANFLTVQANGPYRIVIDATYAYWTSLVQGGPARVLKLGGMASVPIDPNNMSSAIAQDDMWIYWATASQAGPPPDIKRVDKGSFTVIAKLATEASPVQALGADKKYLYWTLPTDCMTATGSVRRVVKDGTMPAEDVAIKYICPTGFGVNDVALYWISQSGLTRLVK